MINFLQCAYAEFRVNFLVWRDYFESEPPHYFWEYINGVYS